MSPAPQPDSAAGLARPTALPRFRTTVGRSAADEALLQLVNALRLGEINVGDHLPPLRELAAAIGISHANTREALKVLERAGVVDVRRGRGGGIFVIDLGNMSEALAVLYPPVPDAEVDMLFEAGAVLEREVAILAARRATPAQLRVLAAKLAGVLAPPAHTMELAERTAHFLLTIAAISGNAFLRDDFAEINSRTALNTYQRGYAAHITPPMIAEILGHYREFYRGVAERDEALIAKIVDERLEMNRRIHAASQRGTRRGRRRTAT